MTVPNSWIEEAGGQAQVTQADREMAADLYLDQLGINEGWFVERLRGGEQDKGAWVQSFARHRVSSQAELVEALKRIAYLRPAGDIDTAVGTRKLVAQIERIALAALANAGKRL